MSRASLNRDPFVDNLKTKKYTIFKVKISNQNVTDIVISNIADGARIRTVGSRPIKYWLKNITF